MLHHVASKRRRIIAADSWACVKALPARKRQVHNPEEAPCSDFTLRPHIRSKFCRGRANRRYRCRTKALVRTKADTLGIPLGPNPCQGEHWKNTVTLGKPLGPAMDATRRRLQGPKRPDSLARSGSRSGRARVPRKEKAKARNATLGIPLGIPLGAATQRCHSCGSHTVSKRQTLLRQTRFAVSARALCITPANPLLYCLTIIDFGFGIHKQRAPIKAWQLHP